jgi:hypothetical protein
LRFCPQLVLLVLLFALHAAAQQKTAPAPHATQPLPDAPSAQTANPRPVKAALYENAPYTPLSRDEKFHRWLHYTYSPYTFTSVTLSATWAQAMGDWPTYGGGMQGYGKRFGATLANTEAGGFFKVFLLPTLLHQDPRYFRSSRKGTAARAWYAATRVVVTRHDSGRSVFNATEVAGTMFGSALTNAYYPERDRGFGHTMSRFSGTLLGDAGANVLREFWPDISRLFKKHAPDKVKKIKAKIPDRIEKVATPGSGE